MWIAYLSAILPTNEWRNFFGTMLDAVLCVCVIAKDENPNANIQPASAIRAIVFLPITVLPYDLSGGQNTMIHEILKDRTG
jgi:hypothetical protein